MIVVRKVRKAFKKCVLGMKLPPLKVKLPKLPSLRKTKVRKDLLLIILAGFNNFFVFPI